MHKPPMQGLGEKTSLSAKYQDVSHITMFMNTNTGFCRTFLHTVRYSTVRTLQYTRVQYSIVVLALL